MVTGKRAAAYGRVSTNSKAQAHSFENQSEYWNNKLANDPQYQYIGLFADKGISGSTMRLRPQMLALVDACRRKEVDIVFTKSVQRFARNTTELLETVRELRELGIAVVFEKENINTLNPDSELYLTIAAAVAEEDLTRYGQNVAWTIHDRFQRGELTVIGMRLFGYETIDKEIRIVPHEAKIVKLMFEMYATGEYSTWKIAKSLNANGIKTTHGVEWKAQQVLTTLKNEKYKGDALLYKSYNEKGRTVVNRGERDMYYVENSHTPIVSRELWEKVQEILASRAVKQIQGKTPPKHLFSGMIECPVCGNKYIHKINSSGTKYACGFFKCYTQLHWGVASCGNSGIKQSVLEEKFIEAYNEFVEKRCYGEEERIMQNRLDKLNNDEKELLALKVKGLINRDDFDHDRAEIVVERKAVEKKLMAYRSAYFKKGELKPITKCDEDLISRILKKVIIRNWVVTFEFYNGVQISRSYDNGRAGNQKGWKEKKMLKEMQDGYCG